MNVLQLISSEGFYGAENMLVQLSASLRGLGCASVAGVFENSHRPNLEVAERARQQGVEVEIIHCRGKADWGAVKAIRDCIKKRKIDLIHAHGYKSNLYGYAAARRFKLPLVATCHLWTRQSAAVRVYDFIDGFVVRRFDAVVGVSDAITQALRRYGLKDSRISRISNGMDFSPFQQALPTLRSELPPASLLVGTVCRLTEQKGLTYLLEAAREILQKHRDVRFVIVGEGAERKKLEDVAAEKGIADRVTFAGIRKDIPEVLASLDVFVLPSIDEGMPMALLEALSAGKPIVATSVGDIPKLILGERTGLLIEPRDVAGLRDSILRLIESPELRLKLGEAGRRFVTEHFSADAMAKSYFTIYQNLVTRHANG